MKRTRLDVLIDCTLSIALGLALYFVIMDGPSLLNR